MKTGDWYEFELHGHNDKRRYKVVGVENGGVIVHDPDTIDLDPEVIIFWPAIKSLVPTTEPVHFEDGTQVGWTDGFGDSLFFLKDGGDWYRVGPADMDDEVVAAYIHDGDMKVI